MNDLIAKQLFLHYLNNKAVNYEINRIIDKCVEQNMPDKYIRQEIIRNLGIKELTKKIVSYYVYGEPLSNLIDEQCKSYLF